MFCRGLVPPCGVNKLTVGAKPHNDIVDEEYLRYYILYIYASYIFYMNLSYVGVYRCHHSDVKWASWCHRQLDCLFNSSFRPVMPKVLLCHYVIMYTSDASWEVGRFFILPQPFGRTSHNGRLCTCDKSTWAAIIPYGLCYDSWYDHRNSMQYTPTHGTLILFYTFSSDSWYNGRFYTFCHDVWYHYR